MNKFFSTSNNEYSPVSGQINYILEQFDQINQFINSNFPSEYHNILAKPEIKGNNVDWYTEKSGDFQLIDSMSSEDYEQMKALYNARRYGIELECERFAQSDDFDRQLWSTILRNAFDPNNLFIFSNGSEIVLVWGIKTLKKEDYSLPMYQFKHLIVPIVKDQNTIESSNDHTIEDDGTIPMDQFGETTKNDSNETAYDKENETLNDDENEITNEEDSTQEQTVGVDSDKPEEIETKEPINPVKPVKPVKQKNVFFRFLDGVESFAIRFWWLLLIILAILLWFLLDKCTNVPESDKKEDTEVLTERKYEKIIPRKNRKRIIVIDTTMFRENPNTGETVVAGLLNIAMVQKKRKFHEMVVKLKEIYPSNDYRIVYRDEETCRIQVQYPENDTNFKREVKSKLSKYKILTWEEAIFTRSRTMNDPGFSDREKSWHINSIKAEKAWDVSMGDTSVVVAIIDDGFDLNHDDLKGKKIIKPYNVASQNTNVFGSSTNFHGTHVAGLAIATANNNIGLCGVAPNCSFMPVQIANGEQYFSLTNVIDGILYALNNDADVINLSLGLEYNEAITNLPVSEMQNIINSQNKDQEKFWKEMFKLAIEKNCVIVMAAGNQNILVGLDPMQRSNEVLKVIATNNRNEKANFSNYCTSCSNKDYFVAAPGKSIWSTMPNNNFDYLDGTSMASPIVTGAVALIKSVNPSLNNRQIMKILKQTSKQTIDSFRFSIIQLDKAIEKAKIN